MTLGTRHDARDRRDVADEIEVELFIERRVDCIRRADQEQRIAVRGRAHDRLGGDIAASARPVLDDERLAEPLRQPLTDQARERCRFAPPGGKADDRCAPAASDRFAPCAIRDKTGSAAAPAARCRNFRRGSFIVASPSREVPFDHLVGAASYGVYVCAPPGRRTVKAEPLPGSLATVTSPPIMRASLRAMARPSPVPPKRCAVEASA